MQKTLHKNQEMDKGGTVRKQKKIVDGMRTYFKETIY